MMNFLRNLRKTQPCLLCEQGFHKDHMFEVQYWQRGTKPAWNLRRLYLCDTCSNDIIQSQRAGQVDEDENDGDFQED